jgi:hypothetical protein
MLHSEGQLMILQQHGAQLSLYQACSLKLQFSWEFVWRNLRLFERVDLSLLMPIFSGRRAFAALTLKIDRFEFIEIELRAFGAR